MDHMISLAAPPGVIMYVLVISLGVIVAWALTVPHMTKPLGNLRHVNQSLKSQKIKILWDEYPWPESGYLPSPLGETHYSLLGPKDGPRLVFVHGITAGSPCFPRFIEGLATAGFRVLTYDLYGRGFSDSPGNLYNEALYTTQLLLTVHSLGWESFHLVGLSLGGGIATSFTTHYPEMVKSLSLIAPAGLLSQLPLIAHLLQFPIIGPLVWHTLGRRFLIRLSEKNYVKSGKEGLNQDVKKAMAMTRYLVQHHPGVMRAYYSTVQHFPLCSMDETFKKLDHLLPGRVGVIWGSKDTVVPFHLLEKFQLLVPSATVFALDSEGHSVVVENPQKCIACILEITGIPRVAKIRSPVTKGLVTDSDQGISTRKTRRRL